MSDFGNPQKPIQIIPILKESLSFYKANFKLLFLISLLGSSITLIEQLLSIIKVPLGWFGSITMIVGMIVSFWAYIALIFAVFEKSNERGVNIKEAFTSTKNKIWRFAGISLFCFLLFVVGSLLFIVPGMYWGVIFALAGLVVVLEDAAFFESLKRSKVLIKGNFWPIFFLSWILFFIFAPQFFIYKSDISTVAKLLTSVFFSILFTPWWIVIDVSIYSRLKKSKSDIEQQEEGEVKKGGGCLGCLSMIGLGIVIIVLSTVWFKNLGGYLKTEKGNKIYEWVSQKVSPKMTFENGISIERPDGYLVMKTQEQFTVYKLYGFHNSKLFVASSWVIPFEDLGITTSPVSLGDGEIWDKYYAYLTSLSSFTEMQFKDMEEDSTDAFDFEGRSWGQYVLREKEGEYTNSRNLCMITLLLIMLSFLSVMVTLRMVRVKKSQFLTQMKLRKY